MEARDGRPAESSDPSAPGDATPPRSGSAISPEPTTDPPTVGAEPAAPTGDPLSEADAAFEHEDHDRALSLYLSVLDSRPDDLRALRRAGLLLGWAGRPKEAVPILEKAVRLDPSDRPTRLQLARVYSWSQEYGPSLRLYDALVAENPSDTTTAIERARVTAWAGRLADSEKAYRAILEKDPGSAEAALGLAQTLGWQGRLDESEAVYRQVLDRQVLDTNQPREGALATTSVSTSATASSARLGLARLALWRGDVGGALRVARSELASDPKNKDALELEKAALDQLRPSLAVAAERTTDTDDNRNVSGSATVSFHPGGLVDIDVTAAHVRERGRDLEAQRLGALDLDGDGTSEISPSERDRLRSLSADALSVAAGFQAGRRGRITLSASAERLGRYERPAPLDTRGRETAVSGYAAWRFVASPVTYRLLLAREIPKWTAFVTERNLRWSHAVAGLEGTLPWSLAWAVSADAGRITGGTTDNDRRLVLARAWRRFDLGGPWVTARYAFRYLGYELNLDDGYFDPRRYISHIVGADLGGRFSAGRFEWTVGAEVGLERFHHDEEDESVCDVFPDAADESSCREGPVVGTGTPAARFRQARSSSETNTVLGYTGRFAWNVRDRFSIEASASRNESAAQTAAGFTSRTFGLAARIRF